MASSYQQLLSWLGSGDSLQPEAPPERRRVAGQAPALSPHCASEQHQHPVRTPAIRPTAVGLYGRWGARGCLYESSWWSRLMVQALA